MTARKRTKNDPQNTKDKATRTPLKPGVNSTALEENLHNLLSNGKVYLIQLYVTRFFFCNKTDGNGITEILLKVAFTTSNSIYCIINDNLFCF